ncbi:hypothetical protein [Poriferisphaera sp. WC338]|uniref:hypothetical protein n=1 Tax=Poriferisphaera sp. WC338 TaxID=3425129 RepID=UPI003D818293
MKITIEPALETWVLPEKSRGSDTSSRADDDIVGCINGHAERLGSDPIRQGVLGEDVIATGHQGWFWHPGILAKDVAVGMMAERLGGHALHLVVDQDAHEALSIKFPIIQKDELLTQTIRLAPHSSTIPIGYQPAVDVCEVKRHLQLLPEPMKSGMLAAWSDLPDCRSLAEQIAVVQMRLMTPYVGRMSLLFASDFPKLASYRNMINEMMRDPAGCVQQYNRAVYEHPQAGITPLLLSRELVELPLWAVRMNQTRKKVYVDIADSIHLLVDERGEVIDTDEYDLLPRALMLTAFMRSHVSGLFVHGTGGYVYDRITEVWMLRWRGVRLWPMVLVTADLQLDLAVPVAGKGDLERAVWYAHHAPHNVDRLLNGMVEDRGLVLEKQEILAHMDDDRDRKRRRGLFFRLHEINEQLGVAHEDVLENAGAQLRRTKVGVKNREIAAKRDWSFPLYTDRQLCGIKEEMVKQLLHCKAEDTEQKVSKSSSCV